MRARLSMIACAAVALTTAACATSSRPISPAGAEYYPASGGTAPATAPGTTTVYAAPYTGTVVRVDPAERVIVFDDGRMWRTAGEEMVVVDNKQVALETVQSGTQVTVQNGYPVTYQNGQYVQVTPATTPRVTTNVMRQTIIGRVTDVDRHEIRVRPDSGRSFEVRMPSTAGIKKGDIVQIDVTVNPSGPAALPR